MKLLLSIIALTLLVICSEADKFDYVRQYLAKHRKSSKPMFKGESAADNNVKNSNTIGSGYNPLYGSPVCYTGTCYADGFRSSAVSLNYVQSATGSCTSKLIPEFVELQCIPSINLQTSTEVISTLNQLSDSSSKTISFGAELKYQMFSAAYSYSKSTSFVIDQITKQDKTVIYTRGETTFGKLRMFEHMMNVSDIFRFTIEHMPCCNEDDLETEQYIQEFLIDEFGLTFVTEILLGGIAQETSIIDNKDVHDIQSKGDDVSHLASLGFYLKINGGPSSSFNLTQHNQYQTKFQTKGITRLGGEPSTSTIDDWIKSVPQNPIVLNFAVKDITKLVNRLHFPNDNDIVNKSRLISMAIQRYLDKQIPTCINDCTDSYHGQCNLSTTGPFLLGTCQCRNGYKGIDCSIDPRTTTITTSTINVARCNRICASRRFVPQARCPGCSADVYYGRGYFCCGGTIGATCSGLFTPDGSTCACSSTDCVIYDSGCGYFGNVNFDAECRCFFCDSV